MSAQQSCFGVARCFACSQPQDDRPNKNNSNEERREEEGKRSRGAATGRGGRLMERSCRRVLTARAQPASASQSDEAGMNGAVNSGSQHEVRGPSGQWKNVFFNRVCTATYCLVFGFFDRLCLFLISILLLINKVAWHTNIQYIQRWSECAINILSGTSIYLYSSKSSPPRNDSSKSRKVKVHSSTE